MRPMGVLIAVLALNICNFASAGGPNDKAPTLKDAWELDEDLDQPESAFCDEAEQTIYISNVNGDANTKDGKGSVHKLNLKGEITKEDFIKNLNAPKGIRRSAQWLIVADIGEVVFADIKTGEVKFKIAIEGSKFINDVAVDEKGDVFVTDTWGSKVYQIKAPITAASQPFEYLKGARWESPNGILVENGRIFLASWGLTTDFTTKTPGRLLDINQKNKQLGIITKKPLGNLDGLERADSRHFFVSDWVAGKVYIVGPLGITHTLKEGYKGQLI